jgi:hypothetical protein
MSHQKRYNYKNMSKFERRYRENTRRDYIRNRILWTLGGFCLASIVILIYEIVRYVILKS